MATLPGARCSVKQVRVLIRSAALNPLPSRSIDLCCMKCVQCGVDVMRSGLVPTLLRSVEVGRCRSVAGSGVGAAAVSSTGDGGWFGAARVLLFSCLSAKVKCGVSGSISSGG